MVGFPGETEEHFEHLREFIEEVRFQHLGVFAYRAEEGTPAAAMPDPVSYTHLDVYKRQHVNLGDDNESDMLADLGEVARVAEEWSMPLLAMLYARGPRISNEYDPAVVAHCARVGVELGADIVKVPYTGDIDSFADVIAGCCVPVVIAGGPRTETTREFLEMVDNSLKAGGSGLSVGRNVFQHPKRVQLVRALRGLVHQGLSLDEALAVVEG